MPQALVLALLLLAPPRQEPDRVAAWTEDALHFVEELERLHPDPWFGCPREEFDGAVDGFLASLEGASESQALVGFLRLVATPSRAGRDGHTLAWPLGARHLPIQPYLFADGWYVVGAEAGHEDLVGARLLALGGVPVEEVCARLDPCLTRDNASNVLAKLPLALSCVELLEGVGLEAPGGRVQVRIERAGAKEELVLPGRVPAPNALFGRPALPSRNVLWLTGRERAWRLQVLEPERALYVQYNEVRSQDDDGGQLADFARELVRTFEERALARVVVDVRSNGGGDNTTFRPLLGALKSPAIDRPGVLFALVGRQTFSAAGNFVTALERETKAILVGEPTGGAPNQYGDAQTVALPHHPDLLVRISTRYHRFSRPDDARTTHEPHLSVPLRVADFFSDRDPVLEAALTYQPPK